MCWLVTLSWVMLGGILENPVEVLVVTMTVLSLCAHEKSKARLGVLLKLEWKSRCLRELFSEKSVGF